VRACYRNRAQAIESVGRSRHLHQAATIHRLRVRRHSLANPRSNETLAKLEIRYLAADLKLVYQASGVA